MKRVPPPGLLNVSLSLFQAELSNDPEFAKKVKGLEGMLRVVNVCAKLIVSVFRSETLLAKVEVGMLALWPQVRPALVSKGPCSAASSAGGLPGRSGCQSGCSR